MVASLLELLGELVAPCRCAACDQHVRPRDLFCELCAVALEPAPPGAVKTTHAVYAYGGSVANAIVRFKFGGRSDLGPRLAVPMADLAAKREALRRSEIVVPVPLHPRRVVERGFDQAALLAKPIARRLGVPWGVATLARTKETPKQSTLDRAARLANVAGAIEVVRPAAIAGRAVLLVDDVATTGATLEACAKALRDAGAKVVTGLVMAAAGRESQENSPLT